MSDARHDQATIDSLCSDRECAGPSWWVCETRGCYEQAKRNYANGIDRRDWLKPRDGEPEYSTDGRIIGSERKTR